jgi:NADH-ubiquinone oxidoreductase chain 2
VLFSALGSSFLISSNDLISMYLSIELQSFALYVLATLYKNSDSSTAAGLKYFLLGGLSSSIILLGSGLIYSYSGLTDLELISSLNNILYNNIYINSPLESNIMSFNQLGGTLLKLDNTDNQEALELTGINLGFILIFVGLLFKIAAAPLHN